MLTRLHDQFNQAVKVKSIVLHTADPQEGPKLIKLFVNRTAIDFEDVQDAEEPEVAQVLDVPKDSVKEGRPIDLRFVRFQSVNSLHVSATSELRFSGHGPWESPYCAADLCQL